MPRTEEEWKEIADGYEDCWQFPHCLGSIDGKHCILQQPACSGSVFFNYKDTFSIVLLAAADADYNFFFVDIGCQGRISDGGVFQNCELFKKLSKNQLNLPCPSPLVGGVDAVPYVFLGDAAFPLSDNVMKPYGGDNLKGSRARIFNYRLSRARRVIENAFGILSVVFRVLRKPMVLQPDNAALIVMTTVCLHNFLRRSKTSRNLYTPPGTFDTEENGVITSGSWRADNEGMSSFFNYFKNIPRRSKKSAEAIRDEFTDHFCTVGAVSWQDKLN